MAKRSNGNAEIQVRFSLGAPLKVKAIIHRFFLLVLGQPYIHRL